jgi:hypothetical protein
MKGENNQEFQTEANLNILIYGYTLLYNVLAIANNYINSNNNGSNVYKEELTIQNYFNLFEIFKSTKSIYKQKMNDMDIEKMTCFYTTMFERRFNYEGCVNLINRYIQYTKANTNEVIESSNNNIQKQFGSNMSEEQLNTISKEYIENYYETPVNQNKRTYKTEHAGLNWTEEDLKKFHEGMKLYGHCQLANNKIAKYMGSHIHVSHVKLFRSKISKEKQINRKKEKEVKIKEMRKQKNWKVATNIEEFK